MDKKQKYIVYGVLATVVVGVVGFFLYKNANENTDVKKGESINLIRK